MTDSLYPRACEFKTQEQADSYDRWFRAKVQESLDSPGSGTSHDQVMAEMESIIVLAQTLQKGKSQ
jgi:hypothetical protein